MIVVARSPQTDGRGIEVLRRQDGLYQFRIAPSGPSAPGIYDTPEQAMSEALASPEWLHPYQGMTTNERLVVAGLLALFTQAILAGERAAAIDLLVRTDVDRDQAWTIVDTLLPPGMPREH